MAKTQIEPLEPREWFARFQWLVVPVVSIMLLLVLLRVTTGG